MLPNINQILYARFKIEGYRIKNCAESHVTSIQKIVQLAYLDVNRTIRGINSEQSVTFKQAIVSFIERFLIKPPKNQEEFDQLHQQCCQQCLACTSPSGALIHYGQAQKILNMSLKYLYNEYAAYKGTRNQFNFPENNVERFFHLPIDSQIRDFLVGTYHFVDPTCLPWSQWSYDHYISFQHQLRKRINTRYCPLEIDYLLWNTNGVSVGDAIVLN